MHRSNKNSILTSHLIPSIEWHMTATCPFLRHDLHDVVLLLVVQHVVARDRQSDGTFLLQMTIARTSHSNAVQYLQHGGYYKYINHGIAIVRVEFLQSTNVR